MDLDRKELGISLCVSVVRDPANSAQWDTYLATTFFDQVVSIGD